MGCCCYWLMPLYVVSQSPGVGGVSPFCWPIHTICAPAADAVAVAEPLKPGVTPVYVALFRYQKAVPFGPTPVTLGTVMPPVNASDTLVVTLPIFWQVTEVVYPP